MHRLRQRCVASDADLANLAIPIRRLVVRIVATSTPELPTAFLRAPALGQLLGVAHCLHALAILFPEVDDKRLRQILAWMIIPPRLSRIQNARFALQMALLANAIPGHYGQSGRIDNISCGRMLHMFRGRTVAALTCDGGGRRT